MVAKYFQSQSSTFKYRESIIPYDFGNIRREDLQDNWVRMPNKTTKQLESVAREGLLVSSTMDHFILSSQKLLKEQEVEIENTILKVAQEDCSPADAIRALKIKNHQTQTALRASADGIHNLNQLLTHTLGVTTMARRDVYLSGTRQSISRDVFSSLRHAPVGEENLFKKETLAQARKDIESSQDTKYFNHRVNISSRDHGKTQQQSTSRNNYNYNQGHKRQNQTSFNHTNVKRNKQDDNQKSSYQKPNHSNYKPPKGRGRKRK